jgi:hypothetical protein
MRKNLPIVFLFVMVLSVPLFAETTSVVDEKNEYGGKTVTDLFSSKDEEYINGKLLNITYYNQIDKKVRIESVFNQQEYNSKGMSTMVTYFDDNENTTKIEYVLTKEHAQKMQLNKFTEYYSNNKKIKVEVCFTAAVAKAGGLSKTVIYFDDNGNQTKTELYDEKGNMKSSVKR